MTLTVGLLSYGVRTHGAGQVTTLWANWSVCEFMFSTLWANWSVCESMFLTILSMWWRNILTCMQIQTFSLIPDKTSDNVSEDRGALQRLHLITGCIWALTRRNDWVGLSRAYKRQTARLRLSPNLRKTQPIRLSHMSSVPFNMSIAMTPRLSLVQKRLWVVS